jgi:hypothetical protein
MSYDNGVRAALRTVQNPTALDVAVAELPNGDIQLRVDHDAVKRLPKPQRAMFAGYLADLVDIIQVHGKVNCEVDMRGAHGQ